MNDRSNEGGRRRDRNDRGGGRDDRGCSGREDRGATGRGSGPDTRFLQLEMSKVLYGEADAITRDAFRALLLEAAKDRLRERFGNEITGLAQLAVDELMADVRASLDIEARIRERNAEQGRTEDRLRDIFGARKDDDSDRDEE